MRHFTHISKLLKKCALKFFLHTQNYHCEEAVKIGSYVRFLNIIQYTSLLVLPLSFDTSETNAVALKKKRLEIIFPGVITYINVLMFIMIKGSQNLLYRFLHGTAAT